MLIKLNSQDCIFGVGMYESVLSCNNFIESELDYLADEYGLSIEQCQDLDFDVNTEEALKDFAGVSIDYIKDEIIRDSKMIKSVKLVDTHSPRFYNYMTDNYTSEFDVNESMLCKFVNKNLAPFKEYVSNEWQHNLDLSDFAKNGFKVSDLLHHDRLGNNDLSLACLDFWLRYQADQEACNDSEEDYYMHMFESCEWSEYCLLDDKSQKIIDNLERVKNDVTTR